MGRTRIFLNEIQKAFALKDTKKEQTVGQKVALESEKKSHARKDDTAHKADNGLTSKIVDNVLPID